MKTTRRRFLGLAVFALVSAAVLGDKAFGLDTGIEALAAPLMSI